MVFNSLPFAGFFLVVYALYRVLPHRAQNVMLLVASYVFYSAWDWRFLSLLVGSTVVDFFVAQYLGRTQDPVRRKRALVLSLSFNLGMLGFFKYFNFFAGNLAALGSLAGLHLDPATLHVVLPIGISFYTFMTMSYVIDVYRREIDPSRRFVEFALFVAYFPHLVAGPILRASRLLPQIEQPRSVTLAQSIEGLWLIGWGLFQKMFVADNLARVAGTVFGASAAPAGVDVLLATYAFAFQIYGDFAGYSNIARGLSKLMGIELNVNFLYPYFVTSPRAFWREWHISLSTWLRDYLYIPLGGNRGSSARTNRNLLITMLLGGLWHGAAWTFVLWGAYQGLVLIAARALEGPHARERSPSALSVRTIVLGILMFHVTCYGWLIFRSQSVGQIASLTHALVTNFHTSDITWPQLASPLLLVLLPFLPIHVLQARADSDSAPMRVSLPLRYAIYGGVAYLLLIWGDFQGAQFIYFRF